MRMENSGWRSKCHGSFFVRIPPTRVTRVAASGACVLAALPSAVLDHQRASKGPLRCSDEKKNRVRSATPPKYSWIPNDEIRYHFMTNKPRATDALNLEDEEAEGG